MKVMVFDVGGTEIKYSVMDEQMNRFDAGSVPTPQDTQEHFLDTIYALYAPHKDEVDGIAMALPGFVDANTGYVSNGGALLYNTGTQVGQLVRERCGCRVTLENDGKAAAIAELRAGALQGCCNAAVFIIGTGVGGGIIANGQLVRGVHFTAGEYSFVNTNADEWENTEKTMACQCSTKYLLKWYRARKGLPADAPMNGKCRRAGSAGSAGTVLQDGGRADLQPDRIAGCGKGSHRRRHQQAAAAAGRSAPGICRAVCFPWGITLHDRSAPLRDRALPFQQRSQSGGSIVYLSAGGKRNHLMASASL